MLQQHQQAFTVSTRGREFHEITKQVGTVAGGAVELLTPGRLLETRAGDFGVAQVKREGLLELFQFVEVPEEIIFSRILTFQLIPSAMATTNYDHLQHFEYFRL